MNRKNVFSIFVFFFALWHGYNILVRPALYFLKSAPLKNEVVAYSNFMLMYPSWSFFSVYPDANVKIEYQVDGAAETKSFYNRGDGFIDLMKFYTCVGCGNAAYQFYFKDFGSGYHWLAGKFICDLNPGAHTIKLIGSKSDPLSNSYQVFKEDNFVCP